MKFLNSGERKTHQEQHVKLSDHCSNEEEVGSDGEKKLKFDKRTELKNARVEIKEKLKEKGLQEKEISMLKLRLRKIKRAE